MVLCRMKKRQFWTSEEETFIRQNYADKGSDYCASSLNKTIDSVKHKARALGIKSNYNKKWTKEEDLLLSENYPILGAKACMALIPNRTYTSINQRASLLRLNTTYHINPKWSNKQYQEKLAELEINADNVEEYINANTPILHQCMEGHQWKATPSHILRDTGCPYCSKYGFKRGAPAILYYIKIVHENLCYYKIGVTNRTVEERFILDKDKIIQVLYIKQFLTGKEAENEERKILKNFQSLRQNIPGFLKSTGNTELFEIDILNYDTQK